MRLSVKDVFVQTDGIAVGKDEVEVLESLRHEERLHAIRLDRLLDGAVVQRSVRNVGYGVLDNRLPHVPCRLQQRSVARDAVQDEDRFDGFGPVHKLE